MYKRIIMQYDVIDDYNGYGVSLIERRTGNAK